ncbi:MAG TPA: cohesin domain-containing protein [Candidatus Cybelea sp.]|nr:cohesin domain-containing protein [Candidatus Cybelea sp.]
MFRKVSLPVVLLAGIVLAGCPKNNNDFDAGRKAEAVQDYDTALVDYERALRQDPSNAEYKLRAMRMHEMDGQFHLQQGEKLLKEGNLEMAMAEFEKARGVDPSNMAVQQEIAKVMEMVEEKGAGKKNVSATPEGEELLAAPPELKPMIHELDGLKMTNQSNVVFETIAKLAGVSVIFDPEFRAQRISIELPKITIEQALDAVALESKAFWKPLTSDVIYVAPDNPQKRTDMEDEIVKTFYIANTLQTQELTEIVTGLRQMLNIQKIAAVNAQNAIVIRATPSQVAAAQKIIDSIDKAKPEVLVHVQVLSANRDRLRDLGILPGQSVAVTFNPRPALQPQSSSTSSSSSSSSSTTTTSTSSVAQVALNNLHSLGAADWSATLPGVTANAILTDDKTRIIQDPEVRVTDGEHAKLTIGEKVPIATGSFQAGVGVGAVGGAGVVNPLVNTQFTYQDVGVTVDVQPRVHPDDEISMKLTVDISSLAGSESIGGINQPIIAQNKIEHEIRLKDGEASVLGGLISRTENVNVNGIPGLAQIPLMRYFFSDNSKEVQDQEVLIVLTPHIIRFPNITAEDLRSLDTGSDRNVRVYREADEALAAPTKADEGLVPAPQPPASAQVNGIRATSSESAENAAAAQLQFDPPDATLKQGDNVTLNLRVANVTDLYSIPLLIHYNPAVIQIQEIRNGGFLSGGTQEIAIVQRIDSERGEAVVSTTRNPNTPGVNGTGTLFGIVVHAVAPGTSPIQILQVNARNSKQQSIALVSGEASVQVQ